MERIEWELGGNWIVATKSEKLQRKSKSCNEIGKVATKLGIDDKYLTSRILKKCIEKYSGSDKNRIYTLKFEPWRLESFLTFEMRKR